MDGQMSKYYNPQRSRNLYRPGCDKPFKVSRSKIDLFNKCPRCFYIDRRLGTGRPPGFPFNLNSAVDSLLKTEFDSHRKAGTQHPILESHGIDARPVAHAQLDDWRENFKGVQSLHEPTKLLITGAIDDLWQEPNGDYVVVDYKATSKKDAMTALDQDWHIGYKRQMEVYQWLFRKNGFDIHETGYFLYINGRKDTSFYDAETGGEMVGRMLFRTTLIPYDGNTEWVDDIIYQCKDTLKSEEIPEGSEGCDSCRYFRERSEIE